MPKSDATWVGTVQSRTTVMIPDRDGHEIGLPLVSGRQQSSDENWNNGRLTYVGFSDTVAGSGKVHGYFFDEHSSGDRAFGTFDSTQTASDTAVTFEGNWKFEGGTGRFSRLKGEGAFKGRWASPTTLEMAWSGPYEL